MAYLAFIEKKKKLINIEISLPCINTYIVAAVVVGVFLKELWKYDKLLNSSFEFWDINMNRIYPSRRLWNTPVF